MHNLIITGLIVGTATVYWGIQQPRVSNISAQNRDLASRVMDAKTELARTQNEASQLAAATANLRGDFKGVQTELAQNANGSAAPLDPAHEGAWPTGKPYFYLAKQRLTEIGCPAFDDSFRLHAAMATLLGLSPAESNAVARASAAFERQLQTLQHQRSEWIKPSEGSLSESHQESAYHITGGGDEMQSLRQKYMADLQAVLGEARSGLLAERMKEDLCEAAGVKDDGEAYVTLMADRASDGAIVHILRIEKRWQGQNTFSSVPVTYPIGPDSPLWLYRQLFGLEPLLK